MLEFGKYDIDNKKCYSKGAICRRNKITGFQSEYDYANPKIRMPFRNKNCSHFHKRRKKNEI
jgi:hypothetical protein